MFDGEPVVAFDLSDEEFEVVRARYRADPSCLVLPDGTPAVPRRTQVVRAHFARKAGFPGTTETETVHHVRAKRAVRDAALAAGWGAQVEARAPSGAWQADVLVWRDECRLAFEVQWSAQTVEEYRARTERYARDGIGVVWLVRRTTRAWWQITFAVDCLPMDAEGIASQAWDSLELRDLLSGVLDLMRHPIPVDAPRLRRTTCWGCGRWFVYRHSDTLFKEKEPFTAAQLRWLRGHGAGVGMRYSQTARRKYSAWLCPRCGAMQGDVPLMMDATDRVTVAGGRLVPDFRGQPLENRLRCFLHPDE